MSKILEWRPKDAAPVLKRSIIQQQPATPTPRSIIAVRQADEDEETPQSRKRSHGYEARKRAVASAASTTRSAYRQVSDTQYTSFLMRSLMPNTNDFATAAGQQISTPFELINYENLSMLNGFGAVINEATYNSDGAPGALGNPLLPNQFVVTLAPASSHPNRDYLLSPRFKGENLGYALSCNAASGRTIFLVVGQVVTIKWKPGNLRRGTSAEHGNLVLTTNCIGGPPTNSVNSITNNPNEYLVSPAVAAAPFFGTRPIPPEDTYLLNVNEAMAYAPLYLVETQASFSVLRVVVLPRPPGDLSREALNELEAREEVV
jgi:hypothetical protein